MLRKARILVVFAALFAAACVPETKTQLSNPGAQPLDARLVGTWYWLDSGGRELVVLTVRRAGDKRFNIIWTEFKPRREHKGDEPPVQYIRYAGHTTRLGKSTFINLSVVDRAAWKSEAPDNTIIRYWLDKDGLRFAFLNAKTFRDAVKEGRLPGQYTKDSVTVTANREALIAFMRRTGTKQSFTNPTKPMRRMPATAD